MSLKDLKARVAYNKEYAQTPERKKQQRIKSWKKQGIIVEDWNTFYDSVLSTTHCEVCQKELTIDRYPTPSRKCVDHDHNISDRPNVRYICCMNCNNSIDRKTNKSGEAYIYWNSLNKNWRFAKSINGKKYGKSGFKTKEEAIAYKKEFICRLKSSKPQPNLVLTLPLVHLPNPNPHRQRANNQRLTTVNVSKP